MMIMQKILVSFICSLALLAFLMPAAIAEDSQNAAANTTLNETRNFTTNLTRNATESAAASLTQAANPDMTTAASPDDSLKSAPSVTQLGSGNATNHSKVLRAGFAIQKPLNNLDVYGNKSTYNVPSRASLGPAFNMSQRLGNVSQFTYNTDNYRPIYNISQYSRTKAFYKVPDTLSSKPVYSISGDPVIR
jgi:hypothetical protein